MTRIWTLHRDVCLDACRPIAENDDPISQKQGLFRIMGHKQGRKPFALP